MAALLWQQANQQYLNQAIAPIRQALTDYIAGTPTNPAALPEPADIDPVLGLQPPALRRLRDRFALSEGERDTLLLCLGMELDLQFEALCIEAQSNPQRNYPTLGLALAALPNTTTRILSADSALQRWQLIEIGDGITLSHAPLRINRRILCYLLGEPASEARLMGVWQSLAVTDTEAVPPSYQALVDQIVVSWQQWTPVGSALQSYPLLQLCGSEPTTQRQIALAACQQQGWNLAQVPAAVLPQNPQEGHILAQQCQRETLLTNSVVLLDCHGINLSEHQRTVTIQQFLDALTVPVIISSSDRLPPRQRPLITLDVKSLPWQEQHSLWEKHLGDLATELNGHLPRLVSQFNLSPTAIQTAALSVQPQPEADDTDTLDRLWNLCRLQARPRLEDLAQRIESNATWDDLILPEDKKAILQDIPNRVLYKSMVYQTWNFAGRTGRGLGVSALFSGVSGTGKTLAADVLARALSLDLYRIDLSSVVSKYIGETEKNLRRIFDAAEAGGAVLLFDEADALFGKRTEVKDSHDRHANVEVSYLLQRIEAYQGLAILTTNLEKSIDQAFLRRFSFSVNFPFPKADLREAIWRRIFPAETPTEGLKYDKLASLNISGGNIRSIALNAAFMAAAAGEPITMAHLLKATQREFIKLGLTLTNAETSGWLSKSKSAQTQPVSQWRRGQ
ncbi:MAG: ATP-binding protein [Leptolyngbya sp. RL_3_1]|nr:ATP-binding protein [Leptolyngbya sp. RL_3_1]